MSFIQRRSIQGFFTRYQFSNRTFWLAIGVAVAIMGVILSWPFVAAPHSRDEVCRDWQGQNVAVAKRRGAKTSRWQKDLMAGDVTPAATHVTLREWAYPPPTLSGCSC